jgi:hypothetical protein
MCNIRTEACSLCKWIASVRQPGRGIEALQPFGHFPTACIRVWREANFVHDGMTTSVMSKSRLTNSAAGMTFAPKPSSDLAAFLADLGLAEASFN